ncbi:hypothetical protein [Adhaeribacter pallidiroseus]|uniref:Uncharacterized protein n=1 Tax=Adhaeribacter pallidiroseus TaxID=2072847 RepID=A0A369QJT4_9BACT|nr:hypothetical protein [Adhaeribacter pallidiroseus]RDC63895.1 hypothetical protein AHMF7616_02504 [Adhaeribacter pallidiroseus]
MTSLLDSDSKNLTKTITKNWLFVQEINAVPVSGSGWNEDYQPANKFLYFSEVSSTVADKKLAKVNCLN